MFIDTGDY